MVTSADSGKHPKTRRGHPERSGAKLIVRQALWHVFDYIEAEGDVSLYKEIVDCLEDELLAKDSEGLKILDELAKVPRSATSGGLTVEVFLTQTWSRTYARMVSQPC